MGGHRCSHSLSNFPSLRAGTRRIAGASALSHILPVWLCTQVTLASSAVRVKGISAMLGHETTLGKTLPLEQKVQGRDTGAPES